MLRSRGAAADEEEAEQLRSAVLSLSSGNDEQLRRQFPLRRIVGRTSSASTAAAEALLLAELQPFFDHFQMDAYLPTALAALALDPQLGRLLCCS